MEKYFLIKYKLFDVVFYADSEYHVYFAQKLTFDSQNLEIRMQFLTFGRQFRNNWFSQQWKEILKKALRHFEACLMANLMVYESMV